VRGRLAPADDGDLRAAVLLVRGPPTVLAGPSTVQRVAGHLRQGLRDAADVLPPDQRGLLPALVVGDVLDPRVRDDLNAAGLGHLTAVSGTNLAIVGGAALVLARVVGLPLPARAAAAALAMVAFAVVARPSPSVLRALLMGLIGALALGTGRARDGVAALAATVLLLMLLASRSRFPPPRASSCSPRAGGTGSPPGCRRAPRPGWPRPWPCPPRPRPRSRPCSC
jgi:competence protein ComEC